MQWIDKAVEYILIFREIAGSILRPAIPTLEWIALIVSGIFIWGSVYSIAKSEWLRSRREYYMDFLGMGDVGRWRQLRAWKQIKKRVQSHDIQNWKLAILEADKLMDDTIKTSGFRADTTDERFKQITTSFLSDAEVIQNVHKIRNRIAQEPDFVITHDQALEILRTYKKAFQDLGLVDY
ncbi:MAG: hypothetical protein HYT03_01670 [Candidatus Harrisonbacteria bacterium]|nr:hypothetical protein [Candidatus Harrisonbacteria bacterium]